MNSAFSCDISTEVDRFCCERAYKLLLCAHLRSSIRIIAATGNRNPGGLRGGQGAGHRTSADTLLGIPGTAQQRLRDILGRGSHQRLSLTGRVRPLKHGRVVRQVTHYPWPRELCEDPIIDDVLTRLQVKGFKNLDRIDVRLGPFTCVAGPNGVGKSNLFDAISFLAALADKPLVEAASTGPSGAHLAATLYDLAQAAQRDHPGGERDVYARVANRPSELVENVRGIAVDVDDERQLLSIVMTDLQNIEHVASALSDGTLRFLALTVMESDPRSRRLLCLEEPENGMHPLRISAVIELLDELAVDVEEPVDADNPLRQVIINTHSPSVVGCVRDDALLVAHAGRGSESAASRLSIRHLPHTWRDQENADEPTVTRGDLLAYLNPLQTIDDGGDAPRAGVRRVMHRADLRQYGLPLAPSGAGPAR